ncbi:MAG: hypothetical protein UW46_C0004G0059 [Candidatus Yanofskybacteria bacterium GW2011_GWF1_44_227]|uniref:Uncharacterized protein n=1 Tax=Candidatus Yanofskybacteria bacterium GW2011_GWE2_40_11 TaxID=1619033 RepID=A0A0G0QJS1_9BACT|nr:MAG: hypothetical protein UT75_C0007G0032 [Candidatus Yanofskybacteria bacterium GW2011_GWE2_40_11]KKT15619.1 MAG: hypothetical protein UV97_C0004G0035 [Candidatus Yanofskybacteria bacterium GW2011_GWF2_43_596]KKT53332.1 MAG: hypothetical protein UW46_C0004G0059 [Candidatus Yanofskybacteria bacterium GW2011_GWF1_44_227]OGN35961.1 MAG: hypothetical protein A2207_02785 [Candidatus Yanofskybacteria bacterium RIFOXYA1_FULL_44_17]OGN36437.1 MAG: hypothetical protein A2241_01700 [Candidatus Yanofs
MDQYLEDQKKELFERLSPEEKINLLGPQLQLYASAVSKKMATLSSVAALSATLIIISTLNRALVPLSDNEIRTVLSIFLILIPISLHIYIKDIEDSAKNSLETIKSYHREDILGDLEKDVLFSDKLVSKSPMVMTCIFYILIGFIILKIWLR